MKHDGYRNRIVDTQLQRALRGAGAVVLEGAKACGKTTTALQAAASVVQLDRDLNAQRNGRADPRLLLDGAVPRLIDEWQLVPEVWNAVRGEVDQRDALGQFILTGSATPADDASRHSGAMRFLRLTMRPMSLFESGLSNGIISLKSLWDGSKVDSVNNEHTLEEVALWAARGGWPSNLKLDTDVALEMNQSYLRTMSSADIITVDGVKRDPSKVEALLGALGRNTGTYVTNRKLQTDSQRFGSSLEPGTIATYLGALIRLWVLAEQPAWGGHLRSSAPARKAAKRHLVDPSLAVAAMRAMPEDLLSDHEAFGQVFETLVFRDLCVYAQASNLDIRAFQDSHGNEIDVVITQGTRWAGLEVKLTPLPKILDDAADKLIGISNRMSSEPRFLAIVTATGASYTRADGVHVVAINNLGA